MKNVIKLLLICLAASVIGHVAQAQDIDRLKRQMMNAMQRRGDVHKALGRFFSSNDLKKPQLVEVLSGTGGRLERVFEEMKTVKGSPPNDVDMLKMAEQRFNESRLNFSDALAGLSSLETQRRLDAEGYLLSYICNMELGNFNAAQSQLTQHIIPTINAITLELDSPGREALTSLSEEYSPRAYVELRRDVMKALFGADLYDPAMGEPFFCLVTTADGVALAFEPDYQPPLESKPIFAAPPVLPPAAIPVSPPAPAAPPPQAAPRRETAPEKVESTVVAERPKPRVIKDDYPKNPPARLQILADYPSPVSPSDSRKAEALFAQGSTDYEIACAELIKARRNLNEVFKFDMLYPQDLRNFIGGMTLDLTKFFERLADNRKIPEYRNIAATLRSYGDRLSKVQKAFKDAIEANPGLVDAYIGLARVNYDAGMITDAMMYLDTAMYLGVDKLTNVDPLSDPTLDSLFWNAAKAYRNDPSLVDYIRPLQFGSENNVVNNSLSEQTSPDVFALAFLKEYNRQRFKGVEERVKKAYGSEKQRLALAKWQAEYMPIAFLVHVRSGELARAELEKVKERVSSENEDWGDLMSKDFVVKKREREEQVENVRPVQPIEFSIAPQLASAEVYGAEARIKVYRRPAYQEDYAVYSDLNMAFRLGTAYDVSLNTIAASPYTNDEAELRAPAGAYFVAIEIKYLRIREDSLLPVHVKTINEYGTRVIKPDLNLVVQEFNQNRIPILFKPEEYDYTSGRVLDMRNAAEKTTAAEQMVQFGKGILSGELLVSGISTIDGQQPYKLMLDLPPIPPPSIASIRNVIQTLAWTTVFLFILI